MLLIQSDQPHKIINFISSRKSFFCQFFAHIRYPCQNKKTPGRKLHFRRLFSARFLQPPGFSFIRMAIMIFHEMNSSNRQESL